MGIADADTAENEVSTASHLITPIACVAPAATGSGPTLSGGNFVEIKPGTLLAQLYGRDRADEQFFCNYGVNPDFEAPLEAAGAIINARGSDGEVRGFEIPGHAFFLATLFQPQLTSVATGEPHPVITGYLKAVALRAREIRSWRYSQIREAPVQRSVDVSWAPRARSARLDRGQTTDGA